MNLATGESLHGFTLLYTNEVPEAHSLAHVMTHKASGARLMFLENDDEDKSFSIAFRTPPKDSTGVFHILEHSVLNGSDKFPVKEPFVNLLKTSMSTFLNAMTFPDKTMYPVSSTNTQDLLNLTDVYLDAVFHPAILKNEKIFQQEGWHLEFDDGGKPIYNGVVFNEMKGALSEPDAVLEDLLMSSLLPDTCYAFESGGDPNEIPELSYEQYINEYKTHYQPSNSYVILYGNIEIDGMLELIDKHLCNANNACEFVPRTITTQAPVVSLGNTKEMVTTPDNACCALAYAIGNATDFQNVVAYEILTDALAGSNEAPLKRLLLDKGISNDVTIAVQDSVAQPYLFAQFKGTNHETAQNLHEIFSDAVKEILERGVDPALIEASLSHIEFLEREYNLGYPNGIMRSISCMNGWLYDDALPYQALQYEEIFAHLRAHLTDGYFEQLLERAVLHNNHYASAEIIPVERTGESAEEQKLQALAGELDQDARAVIAQNVEALRKMQEQPDTPDSLAKLPQLKLIDIGPAAHRPDYYMQENTPNPCLFHEVETNGITYAQQFFDLECISFEDIPYVRVLGVVLGRLDTAFHSAAELDTLIQSKLGNLNFSPKVYQNITDPEKYRFMFCVNGSALSHNAAHIAILGNEILLHTNYSDYERIKKMLVQQKILMEQYFVGSGHSAATARSNSYIQSSAIICEHLTNVDYYRFLKNVLANFDELAPSLAKKLEELAKKIFVDANVLVSLAGEEKACEDYWNASTANAALPHASAAPEKMLQVPAPKAAHEAFIVPADVTFSGISANGLLLQKLGAVENGAFNGCLMLISKAASFDFLWNEIRVKGGAYGSGFSVNQDSNMRFYSYRDPHIDETLNAFKRCASWLSAFSPSQREFEGYVISTTSGIDKPLKPRDLISGQNLNYFCEKDPDFRLRTRKEILDCTIESARNYADVLQAAAEQNTYCCFGSKDIISQAQSEFEVIDLFA